MRLKTSRLSAATAAACAAALVLGGTSVALAQGNSGTQVSGGQGPSSPSADSAAQGPNTDTEEAMVILSEEPLATAVSARTANGRVALGSAEARTHRQRLSSEKSAFRAWLRDNAPKVSVVGSHDIALNAVSVKLNGESLATLRRAPQVTAAQFQGLYYPLAHEDPQLALTDFNGDATQVAGDPDAGVTDKGQRIKVAVIDTGIDPSHPCFDDDRYPVTAQTGPEGLTNNKVIVAKVFSNKRGFAPTDENGHGTHVAGTIGCGVHTSAEIDNGSDEASDAKITEASDGYAPSGVAPAVQLGNYSVFPGPDSSARSEDILNAMEAAYADGMDVINMSLGGGASGIQDLLTVAVDNLDKAGVVSVVAQGNDGPFRYSVGSPGSAERALTVGASSVGHFVGTPVSIEGFADPIGAASGDFPTVAEAGLTASLGVVTSTTKSGATVLSEACAALPADSLAGKIAVISRGSCTFSAKLRVVEAAKAVGALVVNNTVGDPTAMGSDGAASQPDIPAYMVSTDYRAALLKAGGKPATISPDLQYFADTGNDLILASFSSQGPTDVDWRVKPDVVAPGVNILSAQPLSFCPDEDGCWAFYQGTSMATPHVAGAAAVVIDEFLSSSRLDYTAEEVRSAIVNTAEEGVVTKSDDGTTLETNYNLVGAGQLDLDSAVGAELAVGPVSTSFGRVPAGSGQTLTKSVRLTSLTGADQLVKVEVVDMAGPDEAGEPVTFSVAPGSVVVDGDGEPLTVTVHVPRGARFGDHQGMLRFSVGDTEIAHSPVYVNVK